MKLLFHYKLVIQAFFVLNHQCTGKELLSLCLENLGHAAFRITLCSSVLASIFIWINNVTLAFHFLSSVHLLPYIFNISPRTVNSHHEQAHSKKQACLFSIAYISRLISHNLIFQFLFSILCSLHITSLASLHT